MKTIIFLALFFLAILASGSLVYARPQMVKLKTDTQKKQETMARSMAAKVQLSKIKDPEARKAIQAAFDSMGISVKR